MPTTPNSGLRYPASSAAPNVAQDIQNLASDVDGRILDLGAWTSYTPVWTAANGANALGNGSLVGRYRKLGRLVEVDIFLTLGSTSNGGNGNYSFTLPFATAAGREHTLSARTFVVGGNSYTGFAYAAAGSTSVIPLMPIDGTTSRLQIVRNADSGGAAGSGVPIVSGGYPYGTSANLVIFGRYESGS